jgi:hypothetical protein
MLLLDLLARRLFNAQLGFVFRDSPTLAMPTSIVVLVLPAAASVFAYP